MSHRFAIGSLVQFVAASATKGSPYPFMVLEQITQKCHGGTQYSYRLRGGSVTEAIVGINDIELESFVPRESPSPVDYLDAAKTAFVSESNFKAAGAVRELMASLASDAVSSETTDAT